MEQVVEKWLRKIKAPIPLSDFTEELRAHPDFPALVALTDTLDIFGIPNLVLQLDADKIENVPLPFLAHLQDQDAGKLVLVSNKNQLSNRSFLAKWRRVILIAEIPKTFKLSTAHSQRYKQLAARRSEWIIFAVILFLVFGAGLLQKISVFTVSLALTSLGGLLISYVISFHNNGGRTNLLGRFCKSGNNIDCNAVINSGGSSLPFGIKWQDVGFIYFTSILICLWLSAVSEISSYILSVIAGISVLTLPFIMFSIYYQRFIIKTWCPLCLISVGIALAQILLFFPLLSIQNLKIVELIIVLITFLFTGGTYFLLKRYIREYRRLKMADKENIIFRTRPQTFVPLLKTERRIQSRFSNHGLNVGPEDAFVHILVVCHPYCVPCAVAHSIIDEIAKQYPKAVRVSYTFAITTLEKTNKATQAVRYLLQCLQNNRNGAASQMEVSEVLNAWFQHMNYEKFTAIVPGNTNLDVDDHIRDQIEWNLQQDIQRTPTIFLDEHEIPKAYTLRDLPRIINNLINHKKHEAIDALHN